MNNRFNDDDFDEKPKSRQGGGWSWILWAILLLVLGYWIFNVFTSSPVGTTPINYSTFREQVEEGNVTSVLLQGERIEGTLNEPVDVTLPSGEQVSAEQFLTYQPSVPDDELLPLLRSNDVVIETAPAETFSFWSLLLNFLPIVLFLGLGFLLFRRLQGGGGGSELMSMAKSRARRYSATSQRVTFDDVAGAEGAKEELKEVIRFLRDSSRFQKLGAKIPKGVLLVGPPGTGKTLLARAVAGEANAPFFSISGSDFMEMFVGVGASRVRDLFNQAKEKAPAIIFIDELDSIGRRRGTGIGGGHDEREQTLNQLLSEMDGFEVNQNVIIMAATNRPDILDPALLRPGRFDRQIAVDLPTLSDRFEILQVHSRNKPMAEEVDLQQIARGTVGFSGADLANLLNEAALIAARKEKNAIENEDIIEAQDKVILGLERNLILTEDESKLLAYHEAGHAVVAALMPHADPVLKVTIIPRGRAMGVTQQLPERDRYLYPREYMLDRMAVMMGGRAAEEISSNTMTSGASDDLKQATRLARKMVIEWGMSERIGRVSLADESQEVYLGDGIGHSREYSESTAREVDEEVRQILEDAYSRAKTLLQEQRQNLDKVVKVLLEKEQVMGDELLRLLGKESKIPQIQGEVEAIEKGAVPRDEAPTEPGLIPS